MRLVEQLASRPTGTAGWNNWTAVDLTVTGARTTDAGSVTPRTVGGGGGDDGSLPVTGGTTGAVAGLGALLLVGGYLVARRRRTRFVA